MAAAHYRTDNHQNGYAAQAGGNETIGMAQLLGGFPGIAHAANLTGDALYNAWDYLMAQGITVAAGWKTVAGGPTGTNGEPSAAQGLVAGHAYTVCPCCPIVLVRVCVCVCVCFGLKFVFFPEECIAGRPPLAVGRGAECLILFSS